MVDKMGHEPGPSTSGISSLSTVPHSALDNTDNTDISSAGSVTSFGDIPILSTLENSLVDRDINTGYYTHGKILGHGLFGKVRLATHLKTFQHVSLKVINKKQFRNEEDKQAVKNEINSLKVLRHGNIARLLQMIETPERYYIVREYASNGDLYGYVERKGKLGESESRNIFFDLISCLEYMHSRGFTHRDVSPENVLLDSSFRIKLIGFQFAHLHFESFSPSSEMATRPTQHLRPEYTAPELLTDKANSACTPAIDVWSAGVLLYFILTGTHPFTDDTLARLFKKIKTGVFTLQSELREDIGDLIVRMLKVNPSERANVKQILNHRWLECRQKSAIANEMAASDLEDVLDDNALNESILLHPELQNDMTQLKFNIRYKFSYQTATYWLIKENYEQFMGLELKQTSKAPKVSVHRLRQLAGQQIENEVCGATVSTSRHTSSGESRAATNSSKVTLKWTKCKLDEGKRAITTSLGKTESEQSSERKEPNKLGKPGEVASIDDATSRAHAKSFTATADTVDDKRFPGKGKCQSAFNLRKIFFSKRQIADERSNSGKSIKMNSDHGQPCKQGLNQKSPLKMTFSRRLSFAFTSKLLGRNLSQINSAPTLEMSSRQVIGKREFCPPRRRDASEGSLVETSDSDEQRINRGAKSTRISAIDSADELDQGQPLWCDNGSACHSAVDTPFSSVSSLLANRGNVPIKESIHTTIDCLDGPWARTHEAAKINRQKAMPLMTAKKGSSVVIITRYSNYAECLDEAVSLLIKKGINYKADKTKLRCCVSAMNVLLVAFQLEFLTFPSLNRENTYVTIKVKKLRGDSSAFHVIADNLTKHFERRHLRRLHTTLA